MSDTLLTIEYEDGSVVQGIVPGGLLLANAKWIDWLVAANDPLTDNKNTGKDAPHTENE
jgi:hypothetical protein